jgi:hypothetical protein
MAKKKASSRPRHKFNAADRSKSAVVRRESPKNVSAAELKRLISERLRAKDTDARSFVKLLVIYTSYFGKFKRVAKDDPAPASAEVSIEEMVKQIEAEELDKRKGARLREPIAIPR